MSYSNQSPLLLACAILLLATPILGCEETDETPDGTPLPTCSTRVELTTTEFAGGSVLEAGSCWQVNRPLTLSDGLVTVEEGVSIWFATDTNLRVITGGQLRMNGTEANPIELTTGDPLITWQGVKFEGSQGSDNAWTHVVLDNAGSRGWSVAAYSAAALSLEGNVTLSMDSVTIQNSRGHGIVAQGDAVFSFANGTLAGNQAPAYVHPDVAHSIGGETVFVDNETSAVRVGFSNTNQVEGTRSWQALSVPYRIEQRLAITGALTLAPGVVVEVAEDVGIGIESGASLQAIGTVELPITFRGVSAGTRGFWQGIEVKSGGTSDPVNYGAVFDHVAIEDAGGRGWSVNAESFAALYLDATSAAQVTNTTFRNSERYGIWASNDARLDGFAANTFTGGGRVMRLHPNRVGELDTATVISGNDTDRIHVAFGNTDRMNRASSWRSLGVVFEISDRVIIEAALTIEAGVTLEFAQDVRMIVADTGSIATNGDTLAPVVFTGVNQVATGYWTGLQIDSNSPANQLTGARFTSAGSSGFSVNAESFAALYMSANASVTLSDVVFGPGGGYGIFLESGATNVSCTDVSFVDLASGAVYDDDGDTVRATCE